MFFIGTQCRCLELSRDFMSPLIPRCTLSEALFFRAIAADAFIARYLSNSQTSCVCVCCRCFKDAKTVWRISIANLLSTQLDLEVLLENSGSVRLIEINVKNLCNS